MLSKWRLFNKKYGEKLRAISIMDKETQKNLVANLRSGDSEESFNAYKALKDVLQGQSPFGFSLHPHMQNTCTESYCDLMVIIKTKNPDIIQDYLSNITDKDLAKPEDHIHTWQIASYLLVQS